ncbi:MAG: glycosyltransferase family 4 protein [Candidatus Nanopelagicales bacterium]
MTARRPSRPGAKRVLHVLAAYDPKEAQGRCVQTITAAVGVDHYLACARLLAGGEEFVDVVETGASLTDFGWRDRERLAAAVRAVRPDVVHFHGGPLGAATLATGWTGGVPTVASVYAWTTVGRHSFGHGVSLRHLRTTPVLATRTIGNTIAPRGALGAALRRAGVRVALTPDPAVREALAHQAIPVGLFEGITPPRRFGPRTPVPGHFLFAGRAELTRGPDLLADAVQLLRARNVAVSARFCFLSTPDERMVATTTEADGCTVTVGGADLDAEMAGATAVVLPFRFDEATLAPTLVATEALALGVPVVGGDVRCLRSAVTDGETGLLVPPGDVGALARAIERLVDDPAYARWLGANGAMDIAARWARANVGDLARWAYRLATTPEPRLDTRPDARSTEPRGTPEPQEVA